MRDDTPIRRLTRKPATNYTPWIVGGGLVLACVLAFLIGAVTVKYGAHSEGRRLKAASSWWTERATPARIQSIVDDMGKNADVTIYFTADAEFTRCEGDTADGTLRRLAEDQFGVRKYMGVRTDFDDLIYFRDKYPDRFSRPGVIDGGRPRGMRMVRTHGFGRQASKTELANLIEDVLARLPMDGSVR